MDLSYHILIVDDVPDNIQVVMNILKEEDYSLSFATNGQQALELMDNGRFDMLLLDIMMPGIDGYEVCRRIKAIERFKEIPVIFLTARVDIDSITEAFKAGGVDYIMKPFHAEELIARVRTHLELYTAKEMLKKHNISLGVKVKNEQKRLMSELEENQKEMIYVLTELMESTSDETGKHIRRVAEFSRLLAHYCDSLTDEDVEIIYHAAPMHDIGKIAVPYDILHSLGRLSEEEFSIMKTHTSKAHEFLQHSQRKILKAADIIAYEHHEKYDGTGYPRRLKGDNIHIYGRIVAMADVFDALTHKRMYKDAWSIGDAVSYIEAHKGTQFDPVLVDIFMEHIEDFLAILKD